MSLSMTIFTFINAWWIILFFVLPFGVEHGLPTPKRSSGFAQAGEKPVGIEYAAAPKIIRWKKLLLINTIASLLATALLAGLIASGIVPVRDMF